jgi:hydroxyethylthiazole kinase
MRQTSGLSYDDVPRMVATLLERLRAHGPRVHCITNSAAQTFTANVLLAMGCVPSMTLSAEEIEAFVVRSDALLIDLGTFDRERRAAAGLAVNSARQYKLPWVLDPVFVDRSPLRLEFAHWLIEQGPKAMRLNLAEFGALARTEPSRESAMAYARDHKVAVGLTDEIDLVTDGERVTEVVNGHPLMARVAAMGCASSALVAACLAIEEDAWRATTAALVMIGLAGERAAAESVGPGTFATAIIDALYGLETPSLIAHAKVM